MSIIAVVLVRPLKIMILLLISVRALFRNLYWNCSQESCVWGGLSNCNRRILWRWWCWRIQIEAIPADYKEMARSHRREHICQFFWCWRHFKSVFLCAILCGLCDLWIGIKKSYQYAICQALIEIFGYWSRNTYDAKKGLKQTVAKREKQAFRGWNWSMWLQTET